MGKPLSMTGFGRGEASGNDRTWTVELRAVNHRYADTIIKMPRQYAVLEDRVKKKVAQYHTRGRVDLYISVLDEGIETTRLKADVTLARDYLSCLREISRELAVPGEPDLSLLASFRDVVTPQDDVVGPDTIEQLWDDIKGALILALDDCLSMRQNEGAELEKDLLARMAGFEKTVSRIEDSIPDILEKRQAALKERLDSSAPVGRKLDFLIQEFLREVNTIASKINNADTAHLIVDLKNELEKIREQVQNIE